MQDTYRQIRVKVKYFSFQTLTEWLLTIWMYVPTKQKHDAIKYDNDINKDCFWLCLIFQWPLLSALADVMGHRRNAVAIVSGSISSLLVAVMCSVLHDTANVYSMYLLQNFRPDSKIPTKTLWDLSGQVFLTEAAQTTAVLGLRGTHYVWSFGLLLVSIIVGKVTMRYATDVPFVWNERLVTCLVTEMLLFIYSALPLLDIPSFLQSSDSVLGPVTRYMVEKRLELKRILASFVILVLWLQYIRFTLPLAENGLRDTASWYVMGAKVRRYDAPA